MNLFTRYFHKFFRGFRRDQDLMEEKAVEAMEFVRYEEGRLGRFIYRIVRMVMAPIIRFLWVGKVTGMENIPAEGPIIIASNHESYLDFLCFSAISDRKVHYLAAEKLFRSRLWRPLMEITGQIRVDRTHPDKKKVFAQVFHALSQGRIIGIFPEGTRSPDGNFSKAFTGVAKIAVESRVPVIPVGIVGTFDILSRHAKFPKFKKATINIGKPIQFAEYYDTEVTESHHRIITDKIMLQIAELAGKEYLHAERVITNEPEKDQY